MSIEENLKNLICSNCASSEVELIYGQEVVSDISLAVKGTSETYPLMCVCKHCGFSWIPELNINEKDKGRLLREKIILAYALIISCMLLYCLFRLFFY